MMISATSTPSTTSPFSEEDMETLIMAMTSVLGIVVAAALTATCVCCCCGGSVGRKQPQGERLASNTPTRDHRGTGPATAATTTTTERNAPRVQPPHVLLSATSTASSKSVALPGGIVPFKFTQASAAVGRDQAETFRRDRARMLVCLWTVTSTSSEKAPPSRGSNIVITIAPSSQMECPELRYILTLLGSYYNLFVILDWAKSSDELQRSFEDARETLCGSAEGSGSVSSEVLPRHRIIACQSAAGRVAFVRQLHQPKLVIDHDVAVRDELARFGFNVILYPLTADEDVKEGCDSERQTSPLGRLLKPH